MIWRNAPVSVAAPGVSMACKSKLISAACTQDVTANPAMLAAHRVRNLFIFTSPVLAGSIKQVGKVNH
ncbi:MAG: hypothetical protein ACPHVI_02000 [Candidatus Puniceispirillaceae bacterium]